MVVLAHTRCDSFCCRAPSCYLQADIAPAATQLGKGQLTVEAWQQQFGLDAIRDLAVAAQL